jgi:hypothetical protein
MLLTALLGAGHRVRRLTTSGLRCGPWHHEVVGAIADDRRDEGKGLAVSNEMLLARLLCSATVLVKPKSVSAHGWG